MKKIVMYVSLCLASVCASAQGITSYQVIDLSNNENEAENEIAQQVQNYYKQPNPKQALDLSLALMQQPVFENKSQARLNTWLWGAQVLQQHSSFQTRKWCQSLKKSQPPANIAPIFQFANTSAAKRCLKSLDLTENERYELSQLPDLSQPLQRDLLSPSDLDMVWTTFFATGNPKALHKLVDFVANYDVSGSPKSQQATYLAAVWSLQANIHQDEKIKQLVNEYVHSLAPQQQEALKTSLRLMVNYAG